MAARAMWKARVQLGPVSVPVKLYAGVDDRRVHFRLLHDADLVPVKQQLVDPETDEEVDRAATRRGVEVEPGTFVILADEELAELEPEPSREITVERLVPAGALGHEWYDRPYWLGPDGEDEAYFALAAALGHGEREGVAHWTMRKKRYVGSLRAESGYLRLVTLRHEEEVVHAAQLQAPRGRALAEREMAMARQLIEALAAPFEPEEYHDTYADRVRELVEAKGEGREIRLAKFKPREESGSMEDLLAQSLKAARGRRSA